MKTRIHCMSLDPRNPGVWILGVVNHEMMRMKIHASEKSFRLGSFPTSTKKMITRKSPVDFQHFELLEISPGSWFSLWDQAWMDNIKLYPRWPEPHSHLLHLLLRKDQLLLGRRQGWHLSRYSQQERLKRHHNVSIWSETYSLVNKHGYGKWWFIVDFPIKHCDFPPLC